MDPESFSKQPVPGPGPRDSAGNSPGSSLWSWVLGLGPLEGVLGRGCRIRSSPGSRGLLGRGSWFLVLPGPRSFSRGNMSWVLGRGPPVGLACPGSVRLPRGPMRPACRRPVSRGRPRARAPPRLRWIGAPAAPRWHPGPLPCPLGSAAGGRFPAASRAVVTRPRCGPEGQARWGGWPAGGADGRTRGGPGGRGRGDRGSCGKPQRRGQLGGRPRGKCREAARRQSNGGQRGPRFCGRHRGRAGRGPAGNPRGSRGGQIRGEARGPKHPRPISRDRAGGAGRRGETAGGPGPSGGPCGIPRTAPPGLLRPPCGAKLRRPCRWGSAARAGPLAPPRAVDASGGPAAAWTPVPLLRQAAWPVPASA